MSAKPLLILLAAALASTAQASAERRDDAVARAEAELGSPALSTAHAQRPAID